ncbi:MAG: D-alanine--D-alanine ligase, partial [Chloroflexota bacterium]
IDGREFNGLVMGNRDPVVLPVSEIVYQLPLGVPRILTYAAKWEESSPYYRGTKARCPAVLPIGEIEQINKILLAVFRLTGCRGYARVDVRQGSDGGFRVIDINPNPDISPGAGASLQAKVAGMTYTRFIERIIKLAAAQDSP